jgi:hypothetical protein
MTRDEKLPFGFNVNLPTSDDGTVNRWTYPFESDYVQTTVDKPGTFTDPQIVQPYPLIFSEVTKDQTETPPVDNKPIVTFIIFCAMILFVTVF